MAQSTNTGTAPVAMQRTTESAPAYQAFQILHWGFTIVPILAGIDKFLHILGNWDMYCAPIIPQILHLQAHTFMMIVGVVEIIAGVIVALRPRIGSYIVALWLVLIIVNLILVRGFYDVALRDFGLIMGALALARLSDRFDG